MTFDRSDRKERRVYRAPAKQGHGGRRISKCKACSADIIFIMSRKGKWLPCDAKPRQLEEFANGGTVVTEDGQVLNNPPAARGLGIEDPVFVPHWATCPKADRFRKR